MYISVIILNEKTQTTFFAIISMRLHFVFSKYAQTYAFSSVRVLYRDTISQEGTHVTRSYHPFANLPSHTQNPALTDKSFDPRCTSLFVLTQTRQSEVLLTSTETDVNSGRKLLVFSSTLISRREMDSTNRRYLSELTHERDTRDVNDVTHHIII